MTTIWKSQNLKPRDVAVERSWCGSGTISSVMFRSMLFDIHIVIGGK